MEENEIMVESVDTSYPATTASLYEDCGTTCSSNEESDKGNILGLIIGGGLCAAAGFGIAKLVGHCKKKKAQKEAEKLMAEAQAARIQNNSFDTIDIEG